MQGEWQKKWPGEPAAISTEVLLCSQLSKDLSLFFHIKQVFPSPPQLPLMSLFSDPDPGSGEKESQDETRLTDQLTNRRLTDLTNRMIELILWGQKLKEFIKGFF